MSTDTAAKHHTTISQLSHIAHLPTHTLETLRQRIEQRLQQSWQDLSCPAPLKHAIHHSLMAPGKRLRPLLVYTTGLSLGADLALLDAPAMAMECVHTYSLIHDDLPAMDDADLRRGRPSCHTQFDEATAILAGDGLLTWAFELLAHPTHPQNALLQVQMVRCLAQASGPSGMVAGQCMDLTNDLENLAEVRHMHQMKTGALIQACLEMACIASDTTWNGTWQQLSEALGVSYQLQDDLLDTHAESHTLGKPARQDARHDKTTMANVTTPQDNQKRLLEAQDICHDCLRTLSLAESPLPGLITHIFKRTR